VTPVRVGVLAYPGCFASEVFGVPDLLAMARHVAATSAAAGPGYDVAVVSPRRHVLTSSGTRITVDPVRPVDVLVVPGFEIGAAAELDGILASRSVETEVIDSAAASGAAVVGICVGAFLLAEAGLLDGRRSTTSWLFAEHLARRYPATDVHGDQLVVTERGVTTTGAFSAMYDFALDLIGEHDGAAVARSTARIALVDDARTSQTPYVDPDLLPVTAGELSHGVKRRLDRNLAVRYDLGALAADFHVSTRTLLRRFRAETGLTPLGYLHTARIRRARHLLESTDRTVASIAAEVGYDDPGSFAAVFARHTTQRPRDYRSAFRRVTAASRP
jgi:transcriptional regulator GlxA family with amidase domain